MDGAAAVIKCQLFIIHCWYLSYYKEQCGDVWHVHYGLLVQFHQNFNFPNLACGFKVVIKRWHLDRENIELPATVMFMLGPDPNSDHNLSPMHTMNTSSNRKMNNENCTLPEMPPLEMDV